MRRQRTIKREVSFSGVGLHTGRETQVKLIPAPRNTGIVFYRKDKGVYIKASLDNVADTAFATTLCFDNARIKTVEHFLSATSGLGIDNLIVEVVGPEMPALDGSATGFVEILLEAGIAKQAEGVIYIKITKPLIYEDAHSKIICLPFEGRRFSYHMSFNHPVIKEQFVTLNLDEKTFARDIAPARTFGFLKDVEALKSKGLALGGSLDNSVVITEDGILNASGLRFEDEFARHKILDAIGDFALAGYPIIGHLILQRSGHTANIRFLRELLQTHECFTVVKEEDYKPQTAYASLPRP